jgi:hypothetical protein
MTKKKLHFTVDEDQHKNLFDLAVGIFTVTVVVLTLTFGNNSNSRYQQNQEPRSLPQERSQVRNNCSSNISETLIISCNA